MKTMIHNNIYKASKATLYYYSEISAFFGYFIDDNELRYKHFMNGIPRKFVLVINSVNIGY
jgi:hypothetical protein